MTKTANESGLIVSKRITLRGCVQGRGIRPTVARLARACSLGGSVRNEMTGVVIHVSGCAESLDEFIDQLQVQLPPGACLDHVQEAEECYRSFQIEPSLDTGRAETTVPVDHVVCESCLLEVRTPGNRRFGYAFTSCTACGPRYSILRCMPYDRQRTSMSSFVMCETCLQEYQDPLNRRFHSQTNCCPRCGPRLWSSDARGNRILGSEEAMGATIEALRNGEILAIQGVGGYQLVCDATNDRTVTLLRNRKRRPAKPLAVMTVDLDAAGEIADLTRIERQTLQSPAGPIVIARRQLDSDLSDAISPGLRDVGVMLPTSPLHYLVVEAAGVPLVVTSGNVDGQPLEYRQEEAEHRLADVADRFLHHDRDVVRPIDDSVVRCVADRAVTIRAGRGIAPIPLDITTPAPMIAVGGQQKAAIAVSNGLQSALGPHVGDLNSVAARERYVEQTESLSRLYGCDSGVTACDLHPDYFTTQYASALSDVRYNRRSIQHHHAHIVAGMVQSGWLDRAVLGIAFDGTGWGTDATIWGGEILAVTAGGFDRVGYLRPFALAGGEAAIRDPPRVAIALMQDSIADCDAALDLVGVGIVRRKSITALLRSANLSPRTTSVGRLFDGVAAITLPDCRSSFEGEPAMRLEAACDRAEPGGYEISIADGPPVQLDWRPAIRQLLDDKQRGTAPGKMAMRFHRGLAHAVANVAERFPEFPVVLSGGVFQNRVLTELIAEFIPNHRQVGFPSLVPPGDGGLAVGQLAAAASATAVTSVQDPRRTRPCA